MVSLGELDSPEVFKIVNLTVAALSRIFIPGVYIAAFGGVVGLLEFRVPSQAYTYGSFMFSFVGRGLAYIFVGACINDASWFRIISAVLIFLIGIAFVALEAVPSVSPPENMNPDAVSICVQEEDVV